MSEVTFREGNHMDSKRDKDKTPRDDIPSPAPTWTLPASPGLAKKTRSRAVHALSRHNSLKENKVLLVTGMRRTDSVMHPELFHYHDHFEFMEMVGKTQLSEVFKVRHRQTGELFAIKRSRRRFRSKIQRERCLREIRTVAALPRHENIVAQYRAWQEAGHFYIQMDYCEGGSLHQLIAEATKHGRLLTDEQILAVLIDVAHGLDFLHSSSVLHLDIKPENIYRSRLGPWRIGDFGLAVAKESKDWEEGDGDYVAPELLKSGGEPGPAADIFSLGATIYECATGLKVPRKEGSAEAQTPSVPQRSATIQSLLQWMLQADPMSRPSASQILQRLCPPAPSQLLTGSPGEGADLPSPLPGGCTPEAANNAFTFNVLAAQQQQQQQQQEPSNTPTLPFGIAATVGQETRAEPAALLQPRASIKFVQDAAMKWAPSLSPLISEGALTPGAIAGLAGLMPPTGAVAAVAQAPPDEPKQQQQQQQPGSRRLPPLQLPLIHMSSTGVDTSRTAGSNSFRLRRRDLVSPGSGDVGSASESEAYTFSCGTGGSISDLEFGDVLYPTSPALRAGATAQVPASADRAGVQQPQQQRQQSLPVPHDCPAAPSLAWDLHTSPEFLVQLPPPVSPERPLSTDPCFNCSRESSPSGMLSSRSYGSVRQFPTLESLGAQQVEDTSARVSIDRPVERMDSLTGLAAQRFTSTFGRGTRPAGAGAPVPPLLLPSANNGHRRKRQLSSRRTLVHALREGEALASSRSMDLNSSRSIEMLMPQTSKARHGGAFCGEHNLDEESCCTEDEDGMHTYRSGDCGSARMLPAHEATAAAVHHRMTSMTLRDASDDE